MRCCLWGHTELDTTEVTKQQQVFVAACGLSLVVVSGSYSLVAVHRLSIAVAFLVARHRL